MHLFIYFSKGTNDRCSEAVHSWLFGKKIQLHCDSIIMRSSGSTGKKHVLTDRIIYMRPLFKLIKIINATPLPGFHIRKQMPHLPSFGMGIS